MRNVLRFIKHKFSSQHRARRVIGASLVAVATATILINNFSNIGGSFTLAFNTPKPTIDASTKYTAQLPIDFQYESRGYSWYHAGADLVAPTGTPVHSIMPGTVEAVNHDYFGFGNHVIVIHEGGYESIYAHLSRTEVQPGDPVNLNTELGKSGSTGFSTGPHLHLEIHQNGVIVNPVDIVPGIK